MKSISEALTTNPYDRYKALWKDAKEKDWYFTGWAQKLFIVVCFLFTLGSCIYYAYRLIS